MNPFRWFWVRWRLFADWLLQLGLTVGAIYAVLLIDKKELYWLMTVLGCLYLIRLLLSEMEQLILKRKVKGAKRREGEKHETT